MSIAGTRVREGQANAGEWIVLPAGPRPMRYRARAKARRAGRNRRLRSPVQVRRARRYERISGSAREFAYGASLTTRSRPAWKPALAVSIRRAAGWHLAHGRQVGVVTRRVCAVRNLPIVCCARLRALGWRRPGRRSFRLAAAESFIQPSVLGARGRSIEHRQREGAQAQCESSGIGVRGRNT